MDIITVCQLLLRWGIPAAAAGLILALLFFAAYRINRKSGRGIRALSRVQAVSAVLLFCWLVMVLGLTSLSRAANFTGSLNVSFLSGYRSAWNNWSLSELQLILFNMLMFVPLGFLLPLLWKRAESLRITGIVSLGLTTLLESFQFLTGTGIFELDDLFHNLIGSLFGYFCIMAIRSSVRDRAIHPVPVAKALSIPCAVGLILGAVCCVYARQPYGNMSILPAVKQDLSAVRIVSAWEPSGQNPAAAIYRSKYAEDRTYVKRITSSLAALERLSFAKFPRREDENLGYTGTDAHGAACRILFFFRTGEWSYTNFAGQAAQLTQETAQQLRDRYENWMKREELLPEQAVFSVQNGDTLRWDAVEAPGAAAEPAAFQMGSVMVQVDDTGALVNFYYQICWNEYVATEATISEREAFAEVEAGNFEQYVPFQAGDTLYVTECTLSHLYDTKGFYQPVYEFFGYINQPESLWVCRIPARAESKSAG